MSDAPRPTHDDSLEGLLADIAQMLLTLLFLEPDALELAILRRWLAASLQDVRYVLAVLRQHP
jgi:hypothetical protein